MAIASATSSASVSGGLFAQIQQQQAQRNAEQAEAKARALQGQARNAQVEADRAQENARSIKVQSDQASDDASQARQGLAALKSLGETQAQFSDLREQLATIKSGAEISVNAKAASSATAGSALAPVVNSFGQPTGTLVNVTA